MIFDLLRAHLIDLYPKVLAAFHLPSQAGSDEHWHMLSMKVDTMAVFISHSFENKPEFDNIPRNLIWRR